MLYHSFRRNQFSYINCKAEAYAVEWLGRVLRTSVLTVDVPCSYANTGFTRNQLKQTPTSGRSADVKHVEVIRILPRLSLQLPIHRETSLEVASSS